MTSLEKFYKEILQISEKFKIDLREKNQASYSANGLTIVTLSKTDIDDNDIQLSLDELLQIIESSLLIGAKQFACFKDIQSLKIDKNK